MFAKVYTVKLIIVKVSIQLLHSIISPGENIRR